MAKTKPPFLMRRMANDYELASYYGRSYEWLRQRIAELKAEGIEPPAKDKFSGLNDIYQWDAFIDQMNKLDKSYDKSILEEIEDAFH